LYERLNQIPMSENERARAKESLRNAELAVDLVFAALAWIRRSAASAAHRIRIALIAKPQH
jgi:hypothetical protein